jgi:hypothetical protein
MGTRRTVLVLVAGGLVLAGCGGGDGAPVAAPTTTATIATTTAATTTPSPGGGHGGAITRPPAPAAGNAAVLPAGFPLPPGTKVGPVSIGGGDISATLTVPDGKQVYDYWSRRLPAAGYQVTSKDMVGGIGQITFSGRDCTGTSQVGISDQEVTLHCARN